MCIILLAVLDFRCWQLTLTPHYCQNKHWSQDTEEQWEGKHNARKQCACNSFNCILILSFSATVRPGLNSNFNFTSDTFLDLLMCMACFLSAQKEALRCDTAKSTLQEQRLNLQPCRDAQSCTACPAEVEPGRDGCKAHQQQLISQACGVKCWISTGVAAPEQYQNSVALPGRNTRQCQV